MINEIGHFTLLLAFCVALLQATVPLFGAHKGRIDLMAISESAANLQFALLFASFGALTHAFITSDFSDRKSTRLNSSHSQQSRIPSSA